ncbi:MAG: CAAD domain-containing protein, partial [Cyanobacteriota bacterium]
PEQAPEPLAAAPAPVLELEPPAPVLTPVSVAEPAPLAVAEAVAEPEAASTAAPSSEVFGLPLKLLNVLLARIGATPLHAVGDLVPVLRILTLAVVAGIALKLTSATLGAIDDLPLVGGLLELVGLVTLLNFLARNAFKQQKRAELLARIQQLKTDLLG